MRQCMRRILVLTAVLLLAVALSACATVERASRTDSLNRTVKGFAALILWEDFVTAQTYIGVREGTPKEVDLDYLEHIQVTDYDIVRMSLNDEKNEAKVGDVVEVTACRRMSKTKCWRLTRIIRST